MFPIFALYGPGSGADDTARNYFAVAQAALTDLEKDIVGVLNSQFNTIAILKFILVIVGAIWMFHIIESVARGAKKGNVGLLMVEVWNTFYDKGPRVVWYLGLSLALLGVTAGGRVWQERAKENSVILNIGDAPEYDTTGDGGSFEWMSQTFRDLLGTEGGAVPPPLRDLKTASQTASAAINGMDYTLFRGEVQDRLNKAVMEASKGKTVGVGDAAAGAAGTGISWLAGGAGGTMILAVVVGLMDQIMTIILNLAFVMAQFSMAKAILVNYLYLMFAWNMALHFLPVAAMLAYFRSLQGFLVNLAKHLVAMTVAASVIGTLAKELYKSTFWLGDQGLIAMAFKGAAFTGDSQWAASAFPWLTQKYGYAVGMLQIIFLFGAIGMILNEVYGIVRGVMDGAMRTTYQGQGGGVKTIFGGQ